ncbi:hypothetical protein BDN70DRAFT_771411, partial [Pholiota conissans]
CPECPAASPIIKSIQRHFQLKHSSVSRPNAWATTYAQQFNHSTSNEWFRVIVLQDDITQKTPSAIVVAEMEQQLLDATKIPAQEHDARNVTPWLRVTQWYHYTLMYNKDDLRKMVALPTHGEMSFLKAAVERFWADSSKFINETPLLILQKLNTPCAEQSGITNTPFHHHQDHALRMHSYISPVVGLLSMLLRGNFKYPLCLSSNVSFAVNILEKELQKRNSDELSGSVFQVLFALWSQRWMPTSNLPITDPTIVYLMLSSIQKDGKFMEPKLITNIIARLEYVMRLTFLYAMHERDDIEQAAEDLSIWYQEKRDSTFNSLRSLQHIASSIAYSTLSLPKIWWTDRKHHQSLLYKGHPIHFSTFPDMFSAIEDRMEKIWQEELLLGLELQIQYHFLYDDIANTDAGYSFLADTRNHCFSNRMQLLRAVLDTPALYKRFVLYNTGSTILWNILEFRKWLSSYAAFQLLQLMLVMMATGSPSRATEITALLLKNTAANPIRNLMVFDNHVTILCTYQKTSALSGNDKCIPHALTGFSADLLLQDFGIARPFAEMAALLCYPEDLGIVQLYQNHVFINQNRLFNTDDMTNGLKEITIKWLGVELGVNGWRHVSTAFRRKLCTRMEELCEEDQMETVQALQSGHSRQTENRVYALSADSLLGAPEDLLPLFLDASKDWQIACKLIPGGLGHSYRNSKAVFFNSLVNNGTIQLPKSMDKTCNEEVLTLLKQISTEVKAHMEAQHSLEITSAEAEQILFLFHQFALTDQLSSTSVPAGRHEPHPTPSGQLFFGKLRTPSPSNHLDDKQHSPEILDAILSLRTHIDNVVGGMKRSESPPAKSNVSALAMLRQLVGNPLAEWTCTEQKDAVEAALVCERDVVVVLSTGGGKTMVAIIPALLETNKMTVIILPFKSLMIDYQHKLGQMQVPFEVFSGQRIHGKANILLVSADVTKADVWLHEASILHQRKPIVRLVFDEAHIPLLSSDYRPALRDMFRLHFIPTGVQLILLSATISPSILPFLINEFGLSSNPLVLRTKTNRPELQYI